MRLISGKGKFEHAWPIFVALKVLPLRHLYIYKVLRIFFVRSTSFLIERESNYNLRMNEAVLVPRSYLTAHQMFYSSVATRLFNMLDSNIYINKTKKQFLKSLKIWIFGQENVDCLIRVN